MTSDRWNKVQELFEAALDQSTVQRKAFLREACAGDEDLYQDVASLLEEDQTAHSLLDGVAMDAVDVLSDLTMEGRQIGAYLLVRQLGAGGMGTVYLARRADGTFEHEVALKVVKRGMDSEQILRRFQSERQILARLQHPNIARLLDGGITDDGQPYFVMEYVDGLAIDAYCDKHLLSIEDRLSLFQQVCKAVLYAHTNLVVHRDLKPSNILVTDDGEVKLLDFGIAKVLSEDSDETALTQTGAAVMTPEYASPEQVRGEAVNTSTDIYSLGVVLYELLTGVRPYVLSNRSPLEVARVVCESEPERPSTAVGRTTQTGGTQTAETISRARNTETGRLRRRLSGDLDVICLKALRKEAARRYGTVEAFLEDIRRHLSGLPVVARGDTVGYRIRKFVERHRLGVVATALVVLLITTLVGFYTVRLAQERDRAQVEAEKAQQVAAFLQDLFELSDPSESRGATVTARELLDEGAQQIEEELHHQPEVQAQMMGVIGGVYRRLGLLDEARPLLERELTLRRSVFGPRHPEVAGSIHHLAELYRAQGDYDAADSLHQQALAMRRALLGPRHEDIAESLENLASLRRDQGRYEEAEALFQEALAMQRPLLGDESREVATTIAGLGHLYNEQGRYAEAEAQYRAALAIEQPLLGDDHPNVVTILSNLGTVIYDQGKPAEAEDILRQAVTVKRRLYPDGSPSLASSLSGLALALQDQGEYAEAESLYLETLAIDQRLLGAEHPYIASDYGNLATLLYEKGDYDAAEPYYRRALDLRRTLYGTEHPAVATSLNNYAFFLLHTGNPREAEPLFHQTLDILRKTQGEDHPYVANTLHNLAQVRLALGDYAQAEALHKEAHAFRKRVLGDDHPYVAVSESALGAVYTAQGRYEEAEPLLLESQPRIEADMGAQSLLAIEALKRIVELYEAWGKPEDAARYREQLPPQ